MLEETLRAKGVKLFAVIDHSGEPALAGLQTPPTKLLIFGNPEAGTPLVLAAPSIAIDLPLKILVWEDSAGRVQISYIQYGLPPGAPRIAAGANRDHLRRGRPRNGGRGMNA